MRPLDSDVFCFKRVQTFDIWVEAIGTVLFAIFADVKMHVVRIFVDAGSRITTQI